MALKARDQGALHGENGVRVQVLVALLDEPLTRGEVFAAVAQAVGRKRLWQPPALLMRVMAGVVYDMMSRSLRVSNRRFKEVSGWQPLVANARVGWARIIEESRATTSIPTY